METYEKLKSEGSYEANRKKAKKALGDQGSAPNTIYSSSCMNKEKIRKFKKGGLVTKSCK